MIDLADAFANVVDQDRGKWLNIIDPWSGEPTGFRFLVAGPDSDVQRRARLAMMDRLGEEVRADGTVSAEVRENARIECLARCCLGWEVERDGKPLPFSHRACVEVLRGVVWLQAQVDAFAGDRRNFRSEG